MMIYLLRSLYDMLCATFTGQWWFAGQDPLDLDPVPATITNSYNIITDDSGEYDDDDGTPLPPASGSERPVCTACGDPNFSLEGDLCIACRIGMR